MRGKTHSIAMHAAVCGLLTVSVGILELYPRVAKITTKILLSAHSAEDCKVLGLRCSSWVCQGICLVSEEVKTAGCSSVYLVFSHSAEDCKVIGLRCSS